GHEVHVVGEVLPGTGDTFHVGLAAEFTFGTYLAGNAGHLRGERAELIHHDVDGVLQLEDFSASVHGDLGSQVASRHSCGNAGVVVNLVGEISGHVIDVIGEVFPGACHAAHVGLAAELAFGADFTSHAGDFAGKPVELIHHGVDGVLQLQ